MEKTGFVKFSFEKAVNRYTYVWQFEKRVSDLKQWASLAGQDMLESETITFDTGILKNTKHSMKAYFVISKGEIILNTQIGTPSVYDRFTHSKISLPHMSVTLDMLRCCSMDKYNEGFEKAPKECLKIHSLESTSGESDVDERWWINRLQTSHNYYSTIRIDFAFEHTYWRNGTIETKSGENQLTQMNPLPSVTSLDTETLYQTKQLSDFVIFCNDSSFKAHKIVLADRSPVFAAMFEQPLTESQEGKMTMKDAHPASLEQFLKFLYTGYADLEKYATDLFIMADKYSVSNLKKMCELHLINSVTVNNALDLYNWGLFANSEELTNKCIDIMKRNKREMFKTAEDAITFLRDFPIAYRVIFD